MLFDVIVDIFLETDNNPRPNAIKLVHNRVIGE